jgi:hypothetical protein
MLNSPQSQKLTWIGITLFTLAASCFLTFRYFPYEPDVANSPIVWRAFLSEGFSVFRDWLPTPDNWYFTVYPINFIFFTLLSSDGRFALTLSSAFFVFLTPLIIAAINNNANRSHTFILAPILIVGLPAYCYISGFIAHPFSHYSTQFFGVLVFAISFFNLHKQSIPRVVLYSFISILSAVSDPWFAATFFLPLLLVHFYFSWNKTISKKATIIFLIAFVFTMIHAVPRWLHIPVQRFTLVPVEQWLINAEWTVHILGRGLNLFFVDNNLAYIASLIIWVALFLHAVVICWKQNEKARFIALFAFLSIAAIITSFIIGYDMPYEGSARFFVNAYCFVMMVVVLRLSFKRDIFIGCVLALFLSSSGYSYYQHTSPFADSEKQTQAYIDFLDKNDLKFGYGDFWKLSNNVNWMAEGHIHITPVLWRDNYQIMSDSSRGQTLRSWLSDAFIAQSPERQFVSIPAIATADKDSEANQRLAAIRQQLGDPDEVQTFADMTFYIYHHRITFQ